MPTLLGAYHPRAMAERLAFEFGKGSSAGRSDLWSCVGGGDHAHLPDYGGHDLTFAEDFPH